MCCIMRGWFSALLHSNVSLQAFHTLFSFTPLLHTPSCLLSLSLFTAFPTFYVCSDLSVYHFPFPYMYLKLRRPKYVTHTWNLFVCHWSKNVNILLKLSVKMKALAISASFLNTDFFPRTLTFCAVANVCYNNMTARKNLMLNTTGLNQLHVLLWS